MEEIKKIFNKEVLILLRNIFFGGILMFLSLYLIFSVFVLRVDVFDQFKIKVSEYVPFPAVISNEGMMDYFNYVYLKKIAIGLSVEEFNNLIAEKIILNDYVGDDTENDKIEYIKTKKQNLKLYILAK